MGALNEKPASDSAAALYPKLHRAFASAEIVHVESDKNQGSHLLVVEQYEDPVRTRKIREPRVGNRAGRKQGGVRRRVAANRENNARLMDLKAGDYFLLAPEPKRNALKALMNEAVKAQRAATNLEGDGRAFAVRIVPHPVTGADRLQIMRLNMKGKARTSWAKPKQQPAPEPDKPAHQEQLLLEPIPQKVVSTPSKGNRDLRTIFDKVAKTLRNIGEPQTGATSGASINPANN